MRTILSGLFALLVFVVVTDIAQASQGACTTTKTRYAAANAGGTTHSTTPVNFLENVVGFTQGGASAGCVIVRFSAMAEGDSGYTIAVRAILDGATTALPAEVLFSDGGDLTFQVRSFDFIFPTVSPGTHSVRIQFRSPTGIDVSIGQHNIIVQYR